MKKKKYIKFTVISILLLIIVSIKIPIPTLIVRSSDIHYDSKEDIIKKQLSLWDYKPLCDTLLIQDSIRSFVLHIKDAYAYDATWHGEAYIQYFLPWIDVEAINLCFFDVCFENLSINDKLNKVFGIWFSVGDTSRNTVSRTEQYWDDEKKHSSFYGVRIHKPLPDSLYLTVWGYKDLYLDIPGFRSLSEKEQYAFLDKAHNAENAKVVLGEFIFLRGDSIILHPEKEKKLLFNRL